MYLHARTRGQSVAEGLRSPTALTFCARQPPVGGQASKKREERSTTAGPVRYSHTNPQTAHHPVVLRTHASPRGQPTLASHPPPTSHTTLSPPQCPIINYGMPFDYDRRWLVVPIARATLATCPAPPTHTLLPSRCFDGCFTTSFTHSTLTHKTANPTPQHTQTKEHRLGTHPCKTIWPSPLVAGDKPSHVHNLAPTTQ